MEERATNGTMERKQLVVMLLTSAALSLPLKRKLRAQQQVQMALRDDLRSTSTRGYFLSCNLVVLSASETEWRLGDDAEGGDGRSGPRPMAHTRYTQFDPEETYAERPPTSSLSPWVFGPKTSKWNRQTRRASDSRTSIIHCDRGRASQRSRRWRLRSALSLVRVRGAIRSHWGVVQYRR